MRKLVLMISLLAIIPANVNAKGIEAKLRHKYPDARICPVRQIDRHPNILLNRKGKYTLIEKVKGVVVNKRKDGRVLNTDRPEYSYISYKGVKGAKPGRFVTTYCVYDDTNGEDTVIKRYDVVRR